ncbi:MAG: hypothetical protein NTZ33_06155 [Bacteroidetes bacterium]|nr:hypothetical protein [Bacteroidota bacterium]
MEEDLKALSEEDRNFIEKGGVLIRTKDDVYIECITKALPYWHIHAGSGKFESIEARSIYFTKMLELADYKAHF